jgi:hypothetical protein
MYLKLACHGIHRGLLDVPGLQTRLFIIVLGSLDVWFLVYASIVMALQTLQTVIGSYKSYLFISRLKWKTRKEISGRPRNTSRRTRYQASRAWTGMRDAERVGGRHPDVSWASRAQRFSDTFMVMGPHQMLGNIPASIESVMEGAVRYVDAMAKGVDGWDGAWSRVRQGLAVERG